MPRPRGPRWLFGAALGLSALIHILVLLFMRFVVVVPGEAYLVEPAPQVVRVLPGMQVFDVVAVNVDVGPLPPLLEAPEREPVTAPVSPQPVAPRPPSVETVETNARPPTLEERILPRGSDPRLWIPIQPSTPVELDPGAMLEARVAERLAAWNDSMAAEAQRAAKALDWTTTDADGNKWGISPGKIHLGSVTLPLPFGFAPPPGVRDAMRNGVQGWTAIEAQAGRAEVSNAFKDRVKAIRALQDARRDTTKVKKKN